MADEKLTLNAVMSAHGRLLRDSCDELSSLSYAANVMGLTRLADDLSRIAVELQVSFSTLNRAHGDDIYAQFRAAEQSSRNILDTALAMAGAGNASKEER